VTDVAEYIGKKYGGWYPAGQAFLKPDGKKWLGLPLGAAGSMMVYRESQLKAAGFDAFPKTTDDFLKMAKAVAAKGTPGGMALGNATGDGLWCNWLVWAFGGKLVDANNKVVIDSPETLKALEYGKELYATFIPGRCPGSTRTTTRPSSTARSRTPTTASRSTSPPRTRRSEGQGDGCRHPARVVPGRAGRRADGVAPVLQPDDHEVHEVPERREGVPALHDGKGAVRALAHRRAGVCRDAARRLRVGPIWTADPKNTPYRDPVKNMRPAGYAGKLGYASAGAAADFIIVNMVAEGISGSKTPKEAMERAQKRAERYYRV
jgi:multiple sugar transport system substrate-binding protein